MTQIREGLSKADPKPMLIRMVEESNLSTDKKPSPELFSLIKAAATNLLGFGELWTSIKKKGHDEGFSEKELQDMLRPFLKEKLDSKKVWYLFHAEEQKDRSKQQYQQNRTNISTNDAKKVLEIRDSNDRAIAKHLGIDDKLGLNKDPEPEEDPLKIENDFLKEENANLKDAMSKMEQFKPATQLQETKVSLTDPKGLIEKAVFTDENVFQYLQDRAKETGDILDFGRVGSGALVQALAQYKHSFGVVDLIGRVIKK